MSVAENKNKNTCVNLWAYWAAVFNWWNHVINRRDKYANCTILITVLLIIKTMTRRINDRLLSSITCTNILSTCYLYVFVDWYCWYYLNFSFSFVSHYCLGVASCLFSKWHKSFFNPSRWTDLPLSFFYCAIENNSWLDYSTQNG